jgi:hypothetical protein
MSAKKKVLFFAPFGAWVVHHQLDATVAAALQLRGCDVKIVGCDGLFQNCHVTGNPPKPDFCRICTASGQQLFTAFSLPVTQLRSVLKQQDHDDARNWARSLKAEDFPQAQFEGGNLGEWISSEMYSYFRTGKLDYSRKDVVSMSMSSLYNAAILQRAILRIFDDFKPDFVFSYHSVHLYYRIVYELARRRGINVISHERGWIDDSFLVLRDNTVYQYGTRFDACESWKDVPLSQSELIETKRFYEDRELGKNTNFVPMYRFSSNDAEVRSTLRIPADAKIVALFGSGDWEVGMFIGHGPMVFTSQVEWIKKTVEICAKNNAYLIIRHHPLIAGNANYPSGKLFLKNLYALNRELPDNVRVVMPSEKLTSYSIMWNADVGITMFSTAGGEAVLKGVHCMSVTESLFQPMGVELITSVEDYEVKLSSAIQRSHVFNLESLRKAYRYAHGLYFKLSHKFRSFGFKDTYAPDIRIKSLDELRPGVDPALDLVCDNVLNDGSLYVLPEAGERSEKAETEFLQSEFDQIVKHRDEIRASLRSRQLTANPKVSIVAVKQKGAGSRATSFLAKTLRVSRHKNLEIVDLNLSIESPLSYLQKLSAASQGTVGELIYVAPDYVHVDESVFSTTVDLLAKSENQDLQGTSWGSWVCDTEGTPQAHVFTELGKIGNFEAAMSDVKNLADPSQLLSLIVWKKAAFTKVCQELLAKVKANSILDMRGLSLAIFDIALSASPTVKVQTMGIPMITIYPALDLKEVLQQGIQLYQLGRMKEALMLFERFKSMGLSSPELTRWHGMAKIAANATHFLETVNS